MSSSVQFWLESLNGAPQVLELPTDVPRPGVPSFRGARHSFSIDADATARLTRFGQERNATLFMVVFAAFAVVLGRYSGQRDLLIGVPVANRQRGTEDLVGLLTNTLVLRADLSGDPNFDTVLARVKRASLGAYAHQEMPLEKLIELLQPARDTSRQPLFQVMLNFVDIDFSEQLPSGWEVLSGHQDVAQFDLTLYVTRQDGGLQLQVEYATDLFADDTVQRFAQHLLTVLGSATADPKTSVWLLPMLTEREERQLLVEWQAPAADYPTSRCVHELVSEQAARTPAAIALEHNGKTLSYAELEKRSNQLAHFLIKSGVRPETPVGLCLERSLDWVISLLAILKAGGAYVPLDPSYPKDRIAYILDLALPRVAIVEHRKAGPALDALAAKSVSLVVLGERSHEIDGCIDLPPRVEINPNNFAYAFFTSGSTGAPKGACVEHEGFTNHVFSKIDVLKLTSDDCVAQTSSASFDICLWQVFAALVCGGRVSIIDSQVIADPHALVAEFGRTGVSVFQPVPSLLRMMVDGAGSAIGKLSRLRVIVPTGEALSPDLCQKWWDILPSVPIVNAYGATETSDDFTHCRITEPPPSHDAVPLGTPIANSRVIVVDRHGELTPIGVPGEICVAGVVVGRGYLGNAPITAERFVPSRYAPGQRVYRTGDMGRWRSTGTLSFLGRVDSQVKLRGFRVELGEIEAHIKADAAVNDAVVIVREDVPGDQRLVAYLVWSRPETYVNSLAGVLRSKLPAYMVPVAFVVLQSMPLNSNGKLDRGRLPAPNYAADVGECHLPGRSAEEEILCNIWAQLLGLERVSPNDNFFELGGHSLLAAKLLTKMRAVFGTSIGLRDVFANPTPAQIGRLIARSPQAERLAIPKRENDASAICSSAQQRLWFLHDYDQNKSVYNINLAWRLVGEIRMEALQQAVDRVVQRHESLRTTFDFEGDAVRQMIGNGKYPRIAMADLSGQADAELALDRWMTKNAEAPFDLKNDCLLRVGLAQLAPETNVLHLSMHHIISDGWSVGIFEEELSRAYNEYAAGIQAEFADLPIQYGDYAEWEMGRLTGSGYAASQRYWLEYLKDAPTLLTLPSDLPRPAESTYDGEQVRFSFGAELSASLRSLAKACDATLFAVLMSGFSLLLSRHFDEKDICIGYPAANREVEGTGSLIGFFVNTLVFRSKIDERMSATKLVRHVQDALLVSQEHGSFPFEKIVELKNPQRSSSHSPIFQIMFAFNNTARRAIKMHDIVAEKVEHDSRLSKFDLTLEMDGAEPELSGAFRYKRDLYASSMVRKLSARFEALLDALTRNPERPIVQLSHIPQAETAALMEIGSGARSSFPNHFVDELIKAQADRDPGKVAVVFNESSLTYGELDRASSVIARELAQKLPAGVRVVPLLMSSGVNIVVAMLGAIKAGVAFAPLDAAWPDLRLSQIIDDFHGKYILGDCVTQSNIEKLGAIAILVDSLTASADQAEAPQVDRSLGDTMYVMFTSGSTGAPKGVMVNGAGVNNRLAWMNEQFGKAAAQSVIQTTRLTFDSSIWQIFWPLINGGRTILTPVNFSFDPGILLDLIRLHRVSFMNFVPSVFNVLLEALCAGEEAKLALTSLNTVIMGGEEMRPRDVARFRNAHPHVRVFNVYGPTEATIGCLFHEFRGDQGAARVPIGRPIANTQVYILDDGLRPVAQGVVGQLYISGVCLADGYHRQSALTAEKFIPNPFGPAGSRMYGTGDLVRITDAGAVEYLGRNDWQIKVRGMRIELSEIESAMRTHAAVKDVAVVLQKNGSVGQQLVAYVVIRDEYTVLDVDELGKHARRLIPAYMVPAEIRRLSALPLTPNGKLDRNRLPVDSVPSSSANGGRSRPGSGTEELVSFVWAELLENPRLGLDDDFFALGGHSLLAVQVVQRIRSVLGFSVPVAELFRNPTVRAFSAALNDYIPVRANGMIEVRDSGGSEALSLVHDFTGLANCFFGLSKGLLPEYTLLVFEAAMNQGTAPSTIEELADSYIEAMSSRVTGVVNIGGYSFGALVAFEMARKLRAAGRQVGTVLLIAPPLRIGDKQRQNGRRDVDIEIEAQRALESAFRVSSDGAKHLKLIREVAIRHIAAADKYEPGFLDAECVLLQPEADAGDPGIWATLCARLRQVSIPAGHYEVFRSSHIEGTSDAINSILRQSRSGDSDAEHTATR
ncbi:amino acid adenylation domain-containing protein [Bradyrhizobium huanghuaihaiense]|uniref:Amino acid adenylation domain-containing protein n=1 Tax=Bradyrhizobium huanghuaihaiense TaxID=990078 RepID=A0A562R410_9BRAD|nr:non-ribosomal peptide synthetase [Bradyrhizobium huanghuaihaiense]TWI63798.1 amino acid adenylation domain-containing protein [Bradyrhizobium huanghuaihaiense]